MTLAFGAITLGVAMIYTAFNNMSLADLALGRPGPGQPSPIVDTTSIGTTGSSGQNASGGKTTTSTAGGSVKLAPGADRAGVKTKPAVLDAVKRISAVFGKPLTITTGTNHSQYTTSGNVSQHWTGDAADIAMLGSELTRLGQSALIAGGMSEAQAKKIKGGLHNLPNGWQVIFNTMEGGNHYDHLHIGV